MEQSQELLKREFIHHISDTLALLGAGEKIVHQIRQVEEKPFTSQIITELINFNNEHVDEVKSRIVLCNTTLVSKK